jgi:hypothetical protein
MSDAQEVIRVAYDCTPAERAGAVAYLSQFKRLPGAAGLPMRKSRAGSVVLLIILLALGHVLQSDGYLPKVDGISPLGWSRDRQIAFGLFTLGALLMALGSRKVRTPKSDADDRSKEELFYELSDAGIRSEQPEQITVISWQLLLGCDETVDLFILRTWTGQPLVFPKRLFDPQQQSRAGALFATHAAKPAVPQAIGFEVARR